MSKQSFIGSKFTYYSTDAKPTTGVYEGADLYEMDTRKTYIYNSGWTEMVPQISSGGNFSIYSKSNSFVSNITNNQSGQLNITATSGVVFNTGSVVTSVSYLPTGTSDGFLYIPASIGTPTGIPTNRGQNVPLVFDVVNNLLCIFVVSGWRAMTTIEVSTASGFQDMGGNFFIDHNNNIIIYG